MRKRRIWLLLLLLAATIYTALGCYGIVPGVDFVSYDAHMMYGRIADDEQHVGQAVRELQAAVRKARTAEQRSDAYAELAEVYAKERSRLYEFPANSGALCWTELQKGRIRSAVTFFWRGQYYNRAERNSALLEPTCRQAIAAYAQAFGPATPAYCRHVLGLLLPLRANYAVHLDDFFRAHYALCIASLPPGHPDTMAAISALPNSDEVVRAIHKEYQRCDTAGHVPAAWLLQVYEQLLSTADYTPDEFQRMCRRWTTTYLTMLYEQHAPSKYPGAALFLFRIDNEHSAVAAELTEHFCHAAPQFRGTAAQMPLEQVLCACGEFWRDDSQPYAPKMLDRLLSTVQALDPQGLSLIYLWHCRARLAKSTGDNSSALEYCRRGIAIADGYFHTDTQAAILADHWPSRTEEEREILQNLYEEYAPVLRGTGQTKLANDLNRHL